MHDVVIVGGGPAGLTAGIFAVKRKLNALVLEAGEPGGQLLYAFWIENYPGFGKIEGKELAKRFVEHARDAGVQIKREEVNSIEKRGGNFVVRTSDAEYETKSVIIASGAKCRNLGICGENEYMGKGISFSASCDAQNFKGRKVAVIGGGDSALKAAIFCTQFASEVYLIHRRSEFRAEESVQAELKKSGVRLMLNMAPKEFRGDTSIKSILLEDVNSKQTTELQVDGVFVYVGNTPTSSLASKLGVELDEKCFIKVDSMQRTKVPGVFAAGDITGGILQVIAACGEGAVAAVKAYEYVKSHFPE
ncbi:MAG: FAD-dependent oxidoreductase [Candidatus Micrarchaeota archaeon]|nr:FAD-dependent oxidoreductase [Candidatus Micrarchaeota archaeon]